MSGCFRNNYNIRFGNPKNVLFQIMLSRSTKLSFMLPTQSSILNPYLVSW